MSTLSRVIFDQDTTPPSVPGSVTATSLSQTTIRIVWVASTDTGGSGLAGYRVLRATASGGTYAQIGDDLSTSSLVFDDTSLSAGTTWFYRVVAFDNNSNVSSQSSIVSATTQAITAPSVPVSVAATGMSQTTIRISWAGSTGGSGLAGYRVYRATSSGGPFAQVGSDVSAASLVLDDASLSASQTRFYRVTAFDTAGSESAPSAIVSATTQSASGGIQHGQVHRLNASGLGTRPDYNIGNYTWMGHRHIHYRWTDYANGEPATNTQAAWLAATNGFAPSDITNYIARGIRIVNGGVSQSGKYHRRTYGSVGDGSDRQGGMQAFFAGAPNPLTQLYVCTKLRMLGGNYVGPGNAQGKLFRVYTDIHDRDMIVGPDVNLRQNSSPDYPQRYWDRTFVDSTWRRIEFDLASTGTQFRKDGVSMGGTNSQVSGGAVQFTFPFLPGSDSVNGHTLDLPNMLDHASDISPSTPYEYGYCDVYVDFTKARVEVIGGNGKFEVQPIRLWENNGVEIIFNKGELSSGVATARIISSAGLVLNSQNLTIA